MDAADKVDILVVDDNPAKLLALDTILTDLDQHLVKLHSGEEALRRLLTQDFAVILLDVNLPGMDGFETAAMIRQRKQSEHTPIIFTSSISTTETHAARGYSLGAVDYIFTPIVPESLRSKVAVCVGLAKKSAPVRTRAELPAHRQQAGRGVGREAVELVAPLAKQWNVTLDDRTADASWALLGDRQRLKQVLLNLLSNAVKYTPKGGGVRLWAEEAPEGRLRISVRDTGIGIPADRMARLFTPFDRLGAEQTKVEGTGLGLALSKRL